MSYTQDDLTAIERAIIEFAQGNRVGSVTCDGEKIEYSETSLLQLMELKERVARSMAPKRVRYRQIYTDKGLG